MIELINKLFALLAKQHCGIYALLGVIIAFLFFRYAEPDAQIPFIKELIYPVLFIFITSRFLLHIFYERSEIGGKNIPMTTSIVIKDNYFLVKITSNISAYKKIAGYLYVLFRIIDICSQSFVLGFGLFIFLRGV